MEEYHGPHKDHHYWPTAKWDADYYDPADKPAKQPEPAKTEQPQYERFIEREADGSLTYYSVRASEPVILDGMMV